MSAKSAMAYHKRMSASPEWKARRVADNRRRRQANLDKYRDAEYRSLYGITLEDYNRMFQEQGGVCKICGRPPKTKRLNVDHCHKTGRIRGLLCWHCNYKIIGMIERTRTDPNTIAEYLNAK